MKRANPAAVGAFVLGAIALVLVGVIAIGSGSFLHDTQRFVLFFDGSVNGLTVGSPVKMRGVEIGRVLEVNALAEEDRKDILNEVVIEIDPARVKRVGPTVAVAERAQLLVENGLRGRLELQSLVTGQLYIGFDFYQERARTSRRSRVGLSRIADHPVGDRRVRRHRARVHREA